MKNRWIGRQTKGLIKYILDELKQALFCDSWKSNLAIKTMRMFTLEISCTVGIQLSL